MKIDALRVESARFCYRRCTQIEWRKGTRTVLLSTLQLEWIERNETEQNEAVKFYLYWIRFQSNGTDSYKT